MVRLSDLPDYERKHLLEKKHASLGSVTLVCQQQALK